MDRLGQLKIMLHDALGQTAWHTFALLGEADILLPLSAIVAILLWRLGRVSDALAWFASVSICVMAVASLKFGLKDFEWTVYGHTFLTKSFPSGHVAMATAFWGGLALLTARRWSLLLLIPIPIVALTVLVLWWHHTLDIAAGAAIAILSLAPLVLRAPRRSLRSAF